MSSGLAFIAKLFIEQYCMIIFQQNLPYRSATECEISYTCLVQRTIAIITAKTAEILAAFPLLTFSKKLSV